MNLDLSKASGPDCIPLVVLKNCEPELFYILAEIFNNCRIARVFNRSGVTRAVGIDISQAFDRVWHAGLVHKLKCYGISGQVFDRISSFLGNRHLKVVLDGKS